MQIKFKDITVSVDENGMVYVDRIYGYDGAKMPICELDEAGGRTSASLLMHSTDLALSFRYVSHCASDCALEIVQGNGELRLVSRFTGCAETNALRVTQTLTNISDSPKTLESFGTLAFYFGENRINDPRDWRFHKFTNYRYTECLPRVNDFVQLGLGFRYGSFRVDNADNHSSTESIPQGIIEHTKSKRYFMFQIESYTSWRYEVSFRGDKYILQAGGGNKRYEDWSKTLAPGQSYTPPSVAVCYGNSLNGVLAEMTRYRRCIKPRSDADALLPAIYNEYMHYSWDDPFASVTASNLPVIAETGCKYYVIDCGWQAKIVDRAKNPDDVTNAVYRKFGTWYEDLERFPGGIAETARLARSHGMKFGLWIAPEVVGIENEEMLSYYDDSCFFMRNGKRLRHWSGYLLDYRNPKVYDYMSRALERMITDYGCDYIKYDGAPHSGAGTELDSESLGDGLEKAYAAFLDFTADMMKKYPHVIFEDCAGGGQRIDYKALSMFHILSTSDQIRYDHYPYIVGNIFSAVLPEQAGIWSYPVDSELFDTSAPEKTDGKVSRERVVINMVNAILGRIHLASRIHLLSEEKRELVREGVEYYDSITADKLLSTPYLPIGYADFGDSFVCSGLKTDKKVYLAVWNLNGERCVTVPLPEITAKSVKVAYPKAPLGEFRAALEGGELKLEFGENEQARILEIEL